MHELLRTTDIVLISYISALLHDAGISAIVADRYISAVEGSIGAFPQRVLVFAEDMKEAVAIAIDAGLESHLGPGPRSKNSSYR